MNLQNIRSLNLTNSILKPNNPISFLKPTLMVTQMVATKQKPQAATKEE